MKQRLNPSEQIGTDCIKGKEALAEAQLVAAAQAGDRSAFEALIMPQQSRLLRWLTRLTQDRAVAEEILQETLFKAFVALQSFRAESSFATWLAHIAHNTYLSWRKAQARRPDQTALDDETVASEDQWTDWPTCAESPETQLWQRELKQALATALLALPDTWRQAITLREDEGLSYDEIAHIQSVPVGTVRSRIHRARERLSQTLHGLMEPA